METAGSAKHGNPATAQAKPVWRFVSMRAISLDGVPISACCRCTTCSVFQVGKYFLNHYRIFDTGNDGYITAAFTAGFYVYGKNTLQSSCPGH